MTSGVELVYKDGVSGVLQDPNDDRTEMNLGEELKWGNTEDGEPDRSWTRAMATMFWIPVNRGS